MRTIVHLSDVHFGTVDTAVAEKLVEQINALAVDVVVVSGDLTQRARSGEFIEAKAFLDRLPSPQIVVPGNHDVPLYNIFDRFVTPLAKFRKYITDDLTPTYIDDELAIVGINTARSLTIKGGRINREQIGFISATFGSVKDKALKIVVTHHPFDLPEGHDGDDIVGRAKKAMPLIADCGGDVFLAGHLHVSNIETTAKRYRLAGGRIAIVIQAGTATSTRGRGEAHSFNMIRFDRPTLRVVRYECKSVLEGFQPAEEKTYTQIAAGWEHIR